MNCSVGFPFGSVATNGPSAAESAVDFTPFASDFHARIQVSPHEFLTVLVSSNDVARVSVTDGGTGFGARSGHALRDCRISELLVFRLIGEAGIGCPRAVALSATP
jgi:hypothetical protein